MKAMKIVGAALAVSLIGQAARADATGERQAAWRAATAERQAAWRAAIAHTRTPGPGCYQAAYPLTVWHQVACTVAPTRAYIPATGTDHGAQTTGDGNDYAGVTENITLDAKGSFPRAKGLTSETGSGGRPNFYSLQLNSNFMAGNPACAGSFDASKCLAWLQYVYSSGEHQAFMQYWLIHYAGGSVHCPSGWISVSDDCFKNSPSVQVPLQPITELPNISIGGAADLGGFDTLNMTTATQGYAVSNQDSVVFLATGWHGSEFNVIGDGGGSSANFNAGTKLAVRIDLNDGTTKKPGCNANSGTTGETNNLNLGPCLARGGATPFVRLTESN
ncbi:MAG: hypothetical protein JOZ72_11070 [Alphaproteobacteria bacterium]|nr:hypothetical protein [Alphaproteobacteria bacterium]